MLLELIQITLDSFLLDNEKIKKKDRQTKQSSIRITSSSIAFVQAELLIQLFGNAIFAGKPSTKLTRFGQCNI